MVKLLRRHISSSPPSGKNVGVLIDHVFPIIIKEEESQLRPNLLPSVLELSPSVSTTLLTQRMAVVHRFGPLSECLPYAVSQLIEGLFDNLAADLVATFGLGANRGWGSVAFPEFCRPIEIVLDYCSA